MATIDDVARIVGDLPGVDAGSSYGNRGWKLGKTTFAWERAFSKADLKRFGDDPVPEGPILALRTADLDTKDAILTSGIEGVFTIEHFTGYPAVLVRLQAVDDAALEELIMDAWRAAGGRDD